MATSVAALDLNKPIHTRRCRQCFASKPLECYLNKTKTNYCVICDRCRSSQRRRYHLNRLKKLRGQKEESISTSEGKDIGEKDAVAQVLPLNHTRPLPNANQPVQVNNDVNSLVVPSAKWIPVKQPAGMQSMTNNIYVATLLCDPRLQLVSSIPVAPPIHFPSMMTKKCRENEI